MSSYEALVGEHEALAMLIATLRAELRAARPRPDRAFRTLKRLAKALAAHLAHEDREVYPELIASADPATSAIAQQFTRSFGALAEDWVAHLARWPTPPTAADWSEFARETLGMTARLKTRIAEENAVLYPVALAASVITFRCANRRAGARLDV